MSNFWLYQNLRIDEISLVDRGANEEATVTLCKRKGSTMPQGGDSVLSKIRKAFDELGMPDEIKKGVMEALQDDEDGAGDGKPKPAPAPQPAPQPAPGDVEAIAKRDNMIADMKKRLDDRDAEVADLRKRLETNDSFIADLRKRDEISAIAKRLSDEDVPDAENLAKRLHAMSKEDREFFEDRFIAEARQDGMSELTKRRSGGGNASEDDVLEAKIAKRREANPAETREQAYTYLLRNDEQFRRAVTHETRQVAS